MTAPVPHDVRSRRSNYAASSMTGASCTGIASPAAAATLTQAPSPGETFLGPLSSARLYESAFRMGRVCLEASPVAANADDCIRQHPYNRSKLPDLHPDNVSGSSGLPFRSGGKRRSSGRSAGSRRPAIACRLADLPFFWSLRNRGPTAQYAARSHGSRWIQRNDLNRRPSGHVRYARPKSLTRSWLTEASKEC